MPVPATRDDFKEYCLRSLGKPVLQINVDDTQVEDRIDEALYYYQQFHMDAIEHAFIAHQVTANNVTEKYITLDPSVVSVQRVLPPYDSRMSADILFDPQSQFNMSLLSSFTTNSIVPYVIGRQYQQLINETFRGRPGVRFNRHMNRLYVDVNWELNFDTGLYVIVDCYRIIDPETHGQVWSDRWLQKYATALIKRQWGNNLSKYVGIALPGGVTLDGKSMQSEAVQEIKDLEAELQNTFQYPPEFLVG